MNKMDLKFLLKILVFAVLLLAGRFYKGATAQPTMGNRSAYRTGIWVNFAKQPDTLALKPVIKEKKRF